MTVTKPNLKGIKKEDQKSMVQDSNKNAPEMDYATKARKEAAEKARIQSTQTQSKLNIQK